MMTTDQDRVLIVGPDGTPYRGRVDADLGCEPCPDALPDLRDPLTAAGAELVLGSIDPDVEVSRYQGAWAATRPPAKGAPGLAGMFPGIVARGPTKLEATIAAILAAPEK